MLSYKKRKKIKFVITEKLYIDVKQKKIKKTFIFFYFLINIFELKEKKNK